MNIARKICSIRYPHVQSNVHRKFRMSSVNFDSTKADTQIQEEKFDFEDLKVLERVERRKPAIPPFMKNVFLSIFNRDLLAYPEILNKEESTALDNRVSILKKTFEDPKSTVDERREALSRTGMFSAPVALTDGGLAMNYTESLRYLDVISDDLQLGQELSDHWVCLNLLKSGLTSDNYQKIINDLTTGDSTLGVCVQEKISDRVLQADFRTSAVLNQHGVWVINGEKICKTPTKYIIVLCITEGMKLKAFLVHPDASGVNYGENFVTFKDTPGTPLTEASEEQLSKTLGMSRLYTANLCRNSLMKSMKSSVEYVRSRFTAGKPLSELPTIRSQIGDALMTIYASESAEYFTAGLLDGYMDPDAELEVAMCRQVVDKDI
ncbi:Enigma [Danaus plexippus plexippus]|uniref:Enigma n=1 Tax=Danaus plexippus plexippus TaxID=278856 RepID=A0A212F0J5_DANPL|nr:Enigma [Danaus plexippus plexippus]